MRIRRLTALFWTSCVLVFVFILYVVTDLSQKLPGIRPGGQEVDSFQSKLRYLEYELKKHHEIVGEIKSAVDRMVDKSKEYHPPQKRPKIIEDEEVNNVAEENQPKYREFRDFKVVGEEPPRVTVKFNESQCPFRSESPKSDIQMLSMYERMQFDDLDGGAWKQGWNIEYDASQWSSKNKLKVFIVPHSHNDPGWLRTFEEYYKTQTKAIFNNMVEKLLEGFGRKFIWAETSFLSLWWHNDATDTAKASFKKLLDTGFIEIVTGGWVMNDEANSHWLSVVQQLTTGHQWLLDNLGYIPKNGWAIDPFGHSSSQPYLLKLAGFENSVIQRVHYRVKKELAANKQLEFKWRQNWDGVGETDMFTHMMPFYSYDVPHSCGPDPKICCQFDFKRLPGSGLVCPWNVAPRKITQKNVIERASLILDQWRKKAQLYRSNVVLFPLGDDFRYDSALEWKNQYENYEVLIDYINNNDEWNAEVSFGTLHDYFKAVHEETKLSDFPVLSGDFFTYADRQQHYWSGYYTSRPFYKSMDRVLLAYVRAAEIITSQAMVSGVVTRVQSLQLRDRTEHARRALALFQHHDGVTGTSKDPVRKDYAIKMLEAIKYCQSAIQHAAYFLLKKPEIADKTQEDVYFDVDDIWRMHDELPSRLTIALDAVSRARRLVLYNALVFKRTEIITVYVSSPHVEVFDPEGNPVMAQISPVVTGEKHFTFAANKFQLSFPVAVEHLSLAVYTVSLREPETINKYTSYARVRVYNADYMNVDLPKMFAVEKPSARLDDDISFQASDAAADGAGARVVANKDGLIKAVVSSAGVTTPVHMDYVKYGTGNENDNRSGAYLFIPDGPARVVQTDAYPEIVVTEGPHKATLYSALHGAKAADILLSISVLNERSLPQPQVEISNTLLVDADTLDVEVALRLASTIDNGNVFYTDLNGMQMIKRRYMDKIPLQANYYPLPAAVYIEDANTRMTVLTSSPLGVAALRSGQIEIMLDRRLGRDDNRGLNQGVTDNVRTRHTFRLLLESGTGTDCPRAEPSGSGSGQLTLGAHVSQQMLLQPLVVMHYTAPESGPRPTPAKLRGAPGADVVLATFHSHVSAKDKDDKVIHGMGMTFQRVHLDTCYGNKSVEKWYPVGDGQVQVSALTGVSADGVRESSLTFVRAQSRLPGGVLPLCRARLRSVFLDQALHLL